MTYSYQPLFYEPTLYDIHEMIPDPEGFNHESSYELSEDHEDFIDDDYDDRERDRYDDYDYDDSMDGDHESALASCGWGTDEDYGYYGGDEW